MIFQTSILLTVSASVLHQDALRQFLAEQNVLPHTASLPADLHFINSQDQPLQIEDVRQLNQDILLQPYQAEQSIFVIFAIDRASIPAQNALLKCLEEPPAHVQLILTTNYPERILATIQSRCVQKQSTLAAGEESASSSQVLQNQFQHITQGTWSQSIAWAEEYKERPAALAFLAQFLVWLHRTNQQDPLPTYLQALQQTLATQEMIERNVNVRLALEDLGFALKRLFPSSSSSQVTQNQL